MGLEKIIQGAKFSTGVTFTILGIAMAAFGVDVLATGGSNTGNLINEALGPEKVDKQFLGLFKWTESIPRKIDIENILGAPIAVVSAASVWKGSDLVRGK